MTHIFLVRRFMWKKSQEFHVIFQVGIFTWKITCKSHVFFRCDIPRVNIHKDVTCIFRENFYVKKFTRIPCYFLVHFFHVNIITLMTHVLWWGFSREENHKNIHMFFSCFISRENKHVDGTCFPSDDIYVKKVTRNSCDFWCVIFTWK